MEFYLLFVGLLFLIPFPKKWKFVWQLRFIGLAMVALLGGVTIMTKDQGTLSLAEGIALIGVSLVFFYLALRGRKPGKKTEKSQ
jgi:hypothetical protein